MTEIERLKARVAELEDVLARALPVVRLTAYPKLTARIIDVLDRRVAADGQRKHTG